MKDFSQLNVSQQQNGFIGTRIDMPDVFNQPIIVHAFKVAPSKFPKPGREECLHMQIEVEGKKRVLFCTSRVMINTLQNIDPEDFPFKTVIKKNDKRFEFTGCPI